MPKRIHANIGVLLVLMAMVSVSSVRGADNLGVLQGVVKDAAGDGKVWFVENTFNQLGRIDPATGKIDNYAIPVKGAVTRKIGSDSEGNIWVGLHVPGKLMKVDTSPN